MLTSDLLVTRTHKGIIEPVYAPLDDGNLETASSVIDVFQGHIGKTYGELILELEDYEEINYRLIRGLAQILERRCTIDEDSVIDPVLARKTVFEESRGLIIDKEARNETLLRAAEKLSASMPEEIAPDELEKALCADQKDNLIIKEFEPLTAYNLLRQYNLSLVQTLLFRATGMEIQIEDNYQQLFWTIKRLGLMYSIHEGKIYLDGPISLFKLTEKYGTAFAKLLPSIVASSRWSLKASIIKKTPQGKKIYDFILDHTSKDIFGRETAIKESVDGPRTGKVHAPGFDSAIEKEFYQLNFNGWMVRREPAVLKSGRYAFIPDFSLERGGTRIYVEIVGFWTHDYLKNKIHKVNQLEEKDKKSLLLLVNRNLACSGSEFKTENLIFYDKKIPYLEIIKFLRRYEEKQRSDEITKLNGRDISFDISDSDLDIISLDEIAGRHGVSIEALKEVIKGQDKAKYLLMGDQLVSKQILKIIKDDLKDVKKHDDALEIFRGYGIKAHSQVLESLGYRVKWCGLDPENAEILKA
jgi:uncharacterized protein